MADQQPYLLLNLTESHRISEFRQILPYLAESHHISSNLIKCITESHEISLILTKSQRISPKLNVIVGHHAFFALFKLLYLYELDMISSAYKLLFITVGFIVSKKCKTFQL